MTIAVDGRPSKQQKEHRLTLAEVVDALVADGLVEAR